MIEWRTRVHANNKLLDQLPEWLGFSIPTMKTDQ